jgi:hypothetical protein
MMYLNKITNFCALALVPGLALVSGGGGSPRPAEPAAAPVDLERVPVVEFAPLVEPGATRDIDLALCLDTSISMDGLIDSARQRLWALVNELALAEPTPHLRVALLTYGSPGHGAESGWVKTQVALTDDLDMVSMKLFELTTDGGDEYVARVIRAAAEQLEWSQQPGSLKMIVVAGNESAEQDPAVSVELACGLAIEQGIVVNTLYCAQTGGGRGVVPVPLSVSPGLAPSSIAPQSISTATPAQLSTSSIFPVVSPTAPARGPATQPLSEIALGWKRVATLADGAFAMIDKDTGVIMIETPFDDRLAALSTELNATYIPYGSGADWNLSNQVAQDSNAAGLNREAAAARAQTKAGKLYFCGWDLLDSLAAGQLGFEQIEAEQLPEELRALSTEELRSLVDEKREARGRIQTEIGLLGAQRESWLASERAELGTDESMAFDSPLRRAFRELAEARGFRFAEPEEVSVEAETSAGVVILTDC